MNARNTLLGIGILLLAACGGSGGGGEVEESEENTTASLTQFPASFANRVTRVSFDVDKDGTIDRVQRYSYDDQGRITSETREGADGGVTRTVNYVYSDGRLVEINEDDAIETYSYENDRVVSYQYKDLIDDQFSYETSFRYDDSGRLTGTTGRTFLYDPDDCTPFGEPTADPNLSIQYTGDSVSRIESDDGEFELVFSYDADNRLTEASENNSCDGSEFNELSYDNDGRLSSYTRQGIFPSRFEVTYNTAGRVSRTVDADLDIFGAPELSVTTEFTYNDQGLNTLQDSTTVDLDPGFFIFPSFVATIDYADESCVTAVGVNPLRLITLSAFSARVVRNDPFLCTYPAN